MSDRKFDWLIDAGLPALLVCVGSLGTWFVDNINRNSEEKNRRDRLKAAFVAESCAIGRQADGDFTKISFAISKYLSPGFFMPPQDILFEKNIDNIGYLPVAYIGEIYRTHTSLLSLNGILIKNGVEIKGSFVTLENDTVIKDVKIELQNIVDTTKATALGLGKDLPTSQNCVEIHNGKKEWSADSLRY